MKLELLVGKRASGIAKPKDYTDWAESLLYEDLDSENIGILASMGFERDSDSEEIEAYFQKILTDLNLVLPTEKAALRSYAKVICEQIISGDLDPDDGVSILESFYPMSDYEAIYGIWEDLSGDLCLVNDSMGCIFNSGLALENKEEYVKGVAVQFLVLLETILPDRFFHFSACSDCGHIGESEFEVMDKPWMPDKLYRFIYKQGQTQRVICSNCRKPFPHHMNDYVGRKKYLDKKS
ncbi:MAG: hypothetical protein HRU04_10390 [Oceanospirillaceae bacterium]|nr:hypothetical protein [Oceanospirillaceae bacterium]